MPHSLAFSPDASYLELTYTGVVTLEELERVRAEYLAQLAARRCQRLLIDITGQTQPVSMFDLYRLHAATDSLLPPTLRIAMLHRPGDEREVNYYVSLCRRSAVDVSPFTDRAAALDWLLQGQRLTDPAG